MKYSRIINVIFISSLLLLLPTMTPDVHETLILFQDQYVVLSIKTTQVQIDTDIVIPPTVNVSYFNPDTNSLISLYNKTIVNSITLVMPNRGEYLFQFRAQDIGEITISQKGIFITTPIIIAITGLLNFGVIMYKRYFDFSTY